MKKQALHGRKRLVMNGIASLLDASAYTQVVSIWQELETECGLTGIKITPLAHFSWQVAEKFDLDKTAEILERIARKSKPFPASASGLRIFSGQVPVLYIPVVKDENLLRFHANLWEETRLVVEGSNRHYLPQFWIPHITLAYGDVDSIKLDCALQRLAFKPLNLEIQVNNLALVYQDNGEEGWVKYRYVFTA
jgi:2'-5' RNA ligase